MESHSTESKIIQGALEEFAEFGYEGARVDRIAKRAGVNKAMIYYHFKGKEDLYEKIIRETANGVHAYITGKMRTDERTLEGIEAMIFYFADYINNIDLNFMRVMMREISSGGKYVQKIFLPNTLVPFMELFRSYVSDLVAKKIIRNIDPMYTFFQIAGGILYFNMLRIMLKDSELYPAVFRENYLEDFKKNLSLIIREGVKYKEGEV